nr:uncharacterized protein LOC110438777 isoform X4 [Danio rerio]|eukprot:XP_021327604.1 uncharacterized protein LOC110438777 isoform X4 [Danio rerio]
MASLTVEYWRSSKARRDAELSTTFALLSRSFQLVYKNEASSKQCKRTVVLFGLPYCMKVDTKFIKTCETTDEESLIHTTSNSQRQRDKQPFISTESKVLLATSIYASDSNR